MPFLLFTCLQSIILTRHANIENNSVSVVDIITTSVCEWLPSAFLENAYLDPPPLRTEPP